jgi:5-formyltetrahydrofolate cyclo-ligase
MQTKKEQRLFIKKRYKEHTFEQLENLSAQICFWIEQNQSFKKSKYIFAFFPMKDEVNIKPLFEKYHDKVFILPKIVGGNLSLHIHKGKTFLKRESRFGIEEPTTEEFTDYSKIDLALIPGVAFDSSNNRLGRGKGFYDKILTHLSSYRIEKIGICFPYQLIKAIATEPHDVKMDEVVLAKQI